MLPLLLQGLLSGQFTTRLEEPYLGGLTVAVHCTGLWRDSTALPETPKVF